MHGFTNWGNESTITKKNEQLETKYSKYDFIQKLIIQQKANTISLNSQFSTTSDISRFDKLNDIEDGIRKYKNWYYGPQQRLAQSLKINNPISSNSFDCSFLNKLDDFVSLTFS